MCLTFILGHTASLGVLEGGAAAIGGIDALQVEIAATMAGALAIALDFPSLAFVTAQHRRQWPLNSAVVIKGGRTMR